MVICQIMLVLWKKHYFESYQSVTLLGMWLIPLYFSVELLFYRMLFFWGLFTVCTVRASLRLISCRIPTPCGNPDGAMQGVSRVAPRCQLLADVAIGPNILALLNPQGYVTLLASAKPLAKHTPRRVYTYFTMIYKFTYFMTFFGYFLALIDFIGLGVIIQALLHDRKAHP